MCHGSPRRHGQVSADQAEVFNGTNIAACQLDQSHGTSDAMNADQLLQGLTQALFVGVFVVAAARAVRRRLRANVDTALLFGAAAVSISLTWVQQALGIASNQLLTATGSAVAMALPYLLLRLLDDFVGVPL